MRGSAQSRGDFGTQTEGRQTDQTRNGRAEVVKAGRRDDLAGWMVGRRCSQGLEMTILTDGI